MFTSCAAFLHAGRPVILDSRSVPRGPMSHIPPHKFKILAVASGGGHWEQMMLLKDAFSAYNVVFVTTNSDLLHRAGLTAGYIVPDCNRNSPGKSLLSLVRAVSVVIRERPHCVVSTGALPGLFCILAGRLVLSDTVWVDSVANVEKLSMCGAIARRVARLCLTQWKHLAGDDAPVFAGSLL